MNPKRLACLDACIKNPVWTFSGPSAPHVFFETGTTRYYLSAYLADFADLWGPVRLEYTDSGAPDFVTEIEFRGGVIRNNSTVKPHLTGETPCHWYSWTDIDGLSKSDAAFAIPTTKPLLVGTPANTAVLKTDGSLRLRDVCECKGTSRYVLTQPTFELGTKPPSGELNTVTIQASISRFLSFGLGWTFKFDPGRTLKDVIVESWLTLVDDKGYHSPRPHCFDYSVVLEISRCTGHSQRISLWDTLKHPAFQGYFDDTLDEDDRSIVTGFIDRSLSEVSFNDVWRTATSGEKESLKKLVHTVLSALRCTGVNKDGKLQAWDITSRRRTKGRKLEPSWMRMVEDTVHSATFAIITPRCITFPTSSERPHGSRCLEATRLSTRICITADRALSTNDHDDHRNENFERWQGIAIDPSEGDVRRSIIESARIPAGRYRDRMNHIQDRRVKRQASYSLAVVSSVPRATPSTANSSHGSDAPNFSSPITEASGNLAGQTPDLLRSDNDGDSFVCDVTLPFGHALGDYIGALELAIEGSQCQFNLAAASETDLHLAIWKGYSPGKLVRTRTTNWTRTKLPWKSGPVVAAGKSRLGFYARELVISDDPEPHEKVLRVCVM